MTSIFISVHSFCSNISQSGAVLSEGLGITFILYREKIGQINGPNQKIFIIAEMMGFTESKIRPWYYPMDKKNRAGVKSPSRTHHGYTITLKPDRINRKKIVDISTAMNHTQAWTAGRKITAVGNNGRNQCIIDRWVQDHGFVGTTATVLSYYCGE